MVLTAYFVLSPVIGLYCHRRRRKCLPPTCRRRRGVRTTRLRRPRKAPSSLAPPVSTASCPASVTIAIRPSMGQDGGGYRVDLGHAGTELFFQMGLDRANHIDPLQQIAVLLISRAPPRRRLRG